MLVPEKAELVGGEIRLMPPTGGEPGYSGDEIYFSLRKHVERTKSGIAVGDNKTFTVDLPNRQSFSPDAAYYTGPIFPGPYRSAPIFAVEVRSESDYGPVAENAMSQKRADYFAAGTQVAWDVDVLRGKVVHVYRASNPHQPTTYHQGDLAEAEPAVPGWTMLVDEMLHKP